LSAAVTRCGTYFTVTLISPHASNGLLFPLPVPRLFRTDGCFQAVVVPDFGTQNQNFFDVLIDRLALVIGETHHVRDGLRDDVGGFGVVRVVV